MSTASYIRNGNKIAVHLENGTTDITVYKSINAAKQVMRKAFQQGHSVEVLPTKIQNPAKQPAPEYVRNGRKRPRSRDISNDGMTSEAKALLRQAINTVVMYR